LPLTREISAGCASKGARPPGSAGRREAAKAVAWRPVEAALGGDSKRGVRGLVDRAVVLVDRIDCRSRQAAHGPRDPGRIARVIVEWPSLSVREHRWGERAPEAGSRRQSREIGGGRCLRMWAEHMSMEGASGRESSLC